MSNRALVLWSLGLTLPVQFVYVLANLIARLPEAKAKIPLRGGGSFACANLHEGAIEPCTFGEMLVNALFSVLVANVASLGIFFIASTCVVAFVLAVLRKLRSRHAPTEATDSSESDMPSWMREKRDPWWKIW